MNMSMLWHLCGVKRQLQSSSHCAEAMALQSVLLSHTLGWLALELSCDSYLSPVPQQKGWDYRYMAWINQLRLQCSCMCMQVYVHICKEARGQHQAHFQVGFNGTEDNTWVFGGEGGHLGTLSHCCHYISEL